MKLYWRIVTLINFCSVYGCFLATVAELSNCDRDHLTCKAQDIYCLVLYREGFLSLC